jgi:dTDP-4-amino-4,6-dideoxygalactose transaminase
VPQSFPILLEEADRFEVYTRMNEIGYGVVSLYHTLIEPLRNENYFRSKKIADNILNLPLHQDISEEELGNMCEKLEELVNGK